MNSFHITQEEHEARRVELKELYDNYCSIERIDNHVIKTFDSDKSIERVEVIDIRIAEQLRAIGTFVYKFSQLQFMIQHELFLHLELTEEYFDTIISSYDFGTLCRVAGEVFTKKYPEKSVEISKIFKSCLGFNNEKRVRMAHALWAPHPISLAAKHISRQTLKSKTYFASIEELYEMADEAHALMAEIYVILHKNIADYLEQINAEIVYIEAQFEERDGAQKPVWEIKVRKK